MSSIINTVVLYTVFAYENKCLVTKCYILLWAVSVILISLIVMNILQTSLHFCTERYIFKFKDNLIHAIQFPIAYISSPTYIITRLF